MIAVPLMNLWLLKFWGHIGTVDMPVESVAKSLYQVEETFFTPNVAFANGIWVDTHAKGSGVFRVDLQMHLKQDLSPQLISGVRNGAPIYGSEAEKAFRATFPGQVTPLNVRLYQSKDLICAWSAADTYPSKVFMRGSTNLVLTLSHPPSFVDVSPAWICVMAGPKETVAIRRRDSITFKLSNINEIGLSSKEEPVFSRFSGKTYRDRNAKTTVMDVKQLPLTVLDGWIAVAEFDGPMRWRGIKFERSHMGQPFVLEEPARIQSVEKNAMRVASRRWLLNWSSNRARAW